MYFRYSTLVLPFIVMVLGADNSQAQPLQVPLIPVSTPAPLPAYMKGVNLAGAEYAPGPTGVFGTNYIYPTTQEFDYYKSKGFSVIRVPFDIARLQPASLQPLNQAELAHITSAIEYARKLGMYIILDPHNYGLMWSQTANSYQLIGATTYIPNSYFADFWARLSTVYQSYPNVMYGLMNEPNQQNPAQWKASALAAINAIRSVTTTQTILIPGTYFTTAATWTTDGNSAAWTGYSDPAGGPFMFEMHQYLDANYGGTTDVCVTGYGSSVLTSATAWLASNGYRAFLAEFDWYNDFGKTGGVVSPQCQTEGTALLNALQSNPQQWGGWAWLGSGPWAWNNGTNLDPGSDGIQGDQPQSTTLVKFLPGISDGSFETPATGSYIYNPPGSAWTFTANAGVQHNGSAWGAPDAPDGIQTAFLQDGTTGGNGTISQSIYVLSPGTYTVSFQSALRSWRTSSTTMSFNVMIDNTVVGAFSPTSTSFSGVTTSPISLTAGSHILSFVGTGNAPDTADFIDTVTVVPSH
jgi:aryl-phospho-beta-D-glucosidase BglC (GH1 family)